MQRARYASNPARSRGRQHPEPESPLRTAFARDRDRLIHSTAFRRLRYKTQVFVAPDGDHYRVRLTHSIEVAQIARTIARILALDEDLAEVVALAHDLGHPPFGHSGEDALQRAMVAAGGFDHNGHAVRILTLLEQRTPAYDGLNLSYEVLEGIAKHNGPVEAPGWALATANRSWNLDLGGYPGLEAQIAALADDIAYNSHDLDDGLRAGLLTLEQVCAEVPLVADLWQRVKAAWPGERREGLLVKQLVRDLIGAMVDTVLAQTRVRLAELAPDGVEDIRGCGRPTAAFSPAMIAAIQPLRDHLYRHMYTADSVASVRAPAETVIAETFTALRSRPGELPVRWQERLVGADDVAAQRIIGDYLAGMTDRFIIREHRRLTGHSPMPDDSYF